MVSASSVRDAEDTEDAGGADEGGGEKDRSDRGVSGESSRNAGLFSISRSMSSRSSSSSDWVWDRRKEKLSESKDRDSLRTEVAGRVVFV